MSEISAELAALAGHLDSHHALEEGHWWACEHPERPAEKNATHWRPGCERCWPSFLVHVRDPLAEFAIRVDGGWNFAASSSAATEDLRAWFFNEDTEGNAGS